MADSTECTLCGHPHDAHDALPDGTRPCRSIGHPKGLTCRTCKQLTSAEHVEAIMSLRADPPPAFTAAWADYRATLDHVRQEIGEGWQAFFTDVHQAALASAFLAWQQTTAHPGEAL